MKYCGILHGHVCVMKCLIEALDQDTAPLHIAANTTLAEFANTVDPDETAHY